MIRDITLGQYYNVDSKIHRLDPRTKIIATLLYIIELFIVDNFVGFILAALTLLLIIKASKVPISFILRGLKPVIIILMFTFLLNMFMTKGTIIFSFWIFKITEEGLRVAAFMAIRLILLILGSSILTFTTKPLSLTDGLESLFRPFKKIGLPAHEIAMMMSIALRFIPTLLEETDKIIKAQEARGADLESGNVIKKAKALIPILVPLFVSSFRIAQDLALAMEARCYHGGVGRTRLHEMKFKKGDLISFILMAMFLGGLIVLNVYF